MRFIVDAQLPKTLAEFLQAKGLDTIHTIDLPEKNRSSDKEITRISNQDSRIVITKDNDFLSSYIIKKEPPKLIIVTTGNITNLELQKLFEMNIDKIVELLQDNNVIEINRQSIVVQY